MWEGNRLRVRGRRHDDNLVSGQLYFKRGTPADDALCPHSLPELAPVAPPAWLGVDQAWLSSHPPAPSYDSG